MTAETAGRRVQEVLDRLAGEGDAASVAAAEDLVRELMAFYGEGLARLVALLTANGSAVPAALLDDQVVSGLLVLHDLHPESVQQRIRRALAAVPGRPAELIGYAAEAGSVRLRTAPGGCGCGGEEALRRDVEAVFACWAPEVTDIRLEQAPPQPALLQIGRRPPVGADAG
ncbi:hypothetical protein [Kitasatospora sp. NPDC085879]|jgi:hypothetical protein|uniref:hypothetical protein n=1 Tax=Kitasatospora sp. NPDC085879 TaxID=3154769 RepID=UPI000BB14434|nr:hypothetical protein [Streptomyces sp. TLI_235]PBC70841.1 hypothetical protein BX265_5398 [Streptomyces sp. TLI_235]